MTGIIILAAGSSSRMGQAKQNLHYKGQTLLQTAINTALAVNTDAVAIVLGANANVIHSTIKGQAVTVYINDDWETGMGGSISFGLKELLKHQPVLSSVLFMLADQPFADVEVIKTLVEKAAPNKIIASAYNNTLGAPILFDQLYFDDLLAMQGNEGAKKVLQKYPEAVIEVPFAAGAFDIDTPEDYDRLTGKN